MTTPSRQLVGRRRATVALAASALTAGVALLPPVLVAADEPSAVLDSARTALEKWVETRRLISKERRDWAIGREMMTDRIDLVQREIDSLRAGIAEAERNIAEADLKREELVAENERLKEGTDSLAGTLALLEQRTADLARRMPEPIRTRVETLSQRIPRNPDETRLSISDRFLNVVGILNETNKFNREVTVTSEVRALPDGTSVEVAAVYLGIGKAYYVNNKGTVAGIGTSSPEGWKWTPANEAAPQIARVVAILKNEDVAAFVPLPFKIDEGSP